MTSATQSQQRGIQLTEAALQHILFLRDRQGQDLCLRVGVRQGGCSGMSYMMDFEDISQVRADDEVYELWNVLHDGF